MPAKPINKHKHIAIIGGGPSGMFAYKRLIESSVKDIEISIFEKKLKLGIGMPYSPEGATQEHITNVSDNEIPPIVISINEWVKIAPKTLLKMYNITPENFNEYKVLPRLFFGEYMAAQFDQLIQKAKKAGIKTHIHISTNVDDIVDNRGRKNVTVSYEDKTADFDAVIISTGHNWPTRYEGMVPGFFESPYPPLKIAQKIDYPVAIKGSSLTAVDAVRTLARANGTFLKKDGKLHYVIDKDSVGFRIVMHSRSGMLPAVRFHLADTHLRNNSLLTTEQIEEHIKNNNGFLSLDFIFEKDFKDPIKAKDPEFYARIKKMSVEEFVRHMLETRAEQDAFKLLKAEYDEAAISIKKHKSVYWKEMLGVLSFALNYPAKHLSAEDMQRLHNVMLPLISIVIAYMPQTSCEEFMAMHAAGLLHIKAVGADSFVKPKKTGGALYHYTDSKGVQQADFFKMYVDSVGQPPLNYAQFPFKGLCRHRTLTPALLKFRDSNAGKAAFKADKKSVVKSTSGEFYLRVPGVAINDNFQVVNAAGKGNERVYLMAVPYMAGYNPDYSGLDFCEEASTRIVNTILNI